MHGRSYAAQRDAVEEALTALVIALQQNLADTELAIQRANAIQAMRAKGQAYRDILAETGKPVVVEIISANLERLNSAGAALRHAEAKALHDEGLTMQQIAELYGVSRQRISALLRGGR